MSGEAKQRNLWPSYVEIKISRKIAWLVYALGGWLDSLVATNIDRSVVPQRVLITPMLLDCSGLYGMDAVRFRSFVAHLFRCRSRGKRALNGWLCQRYTVALRPVRASHVQTEVATELHDQGSGWRAAQPCAAGHLAIWFGAGPMSCPCLLF